VYYNLDENNLPPVGDALRVWGIQQQFTFPTVYGKQRQALKGAYEVQEKQFDLDNRKLAQEVSRAYYEVVYWQHLQRYYISLDSVYTDFARAAARRYQLGETNYLEKLTADTKKQEAQLQVNQTQASIEAAYVALKRWLQTDEPIVISESTLTPVQSDNNGFQNHPGLMYYEQLKQYAEFNSQLEKNKLLPDIHLAYFQGRNAAENDKLYQGINIGLGIPLWYGAQRANIKSAQLNVQRTEQLATDYQSTLTTAHERLLRERDKYQQALDFYNTSGKLLADETLITARKSFVSGEINFLQYVQALDQAMQIRMNYLNNLRLYNTTVIELNYLMN
jgi:cobalt-zinc-cadmium resistance protein CzcA